MASTALCTVAMACLLEAKRVELILRPPESYRGPSAEGLIVVGMERAATPDGAEAVVFTNETWLWRRRDEPLLILERALGRWFHELLAGWLIVKGSRECDDWEEKVTDV